jgi:hypothetical protein
MMLQGIIANQKEIFATLGSGNPIVTIPKMVRAYQLQAEAAGVENPEMFYGDAVNPDGTPYQWQPPPPQPTPDTVVNAQTLERIEERKVRAKLQTDIYKINVDAAKDAAEKDYQYAKLGLDAVAKDAEYAARLMEMQLEADDKARAEKPERDDKTDDKLAAAINGMTQVIRDVNKPKRIVRDKTGKAIGTESVN